MGSVLRFPNAVSDIGKFIETFRQIFSRLENFSSFSHDNATEVLVNNGLASSSGAIGQEALRRSTRADRSRDPLYNQHKMYSEVYRMLGWYQPGTQRTNFMFTELSPYVYDSSEITRNKIFEECLLGISFPNHLVDNRGGNCLRPFAFLIKLMNECGGKMLRDEIILTILALDNDLKNGSLMKQSRKVKDFRGDFEKLQDALQQLALDNSTQVNTLQNYTRFVLGALTFSGYAISIRDNELYEKSLVTYQLTEKGTELAKSLNKLVDVRNDDIQSFSLDERGAFTLLMHYTFLERIGLPIEDLIKSISLLEKMCENIFDKLKIQDRYQILYSPIQQSSKEEILKANEIEKKI